MLDYLDKLRAKPVYVRQRIALVATVALSLMVFGVWWGTWNTESVSLSATVAAATPSPWSAVLGTIARAKDDALAAFRGANDQLEYATKEIGQAEALEGASDAKMTRDEKSNGASVVLGDVVYSEAVGKSGKGTIIETQPKTGSTRSPGEVIHTRPKTASPTGAQTIPEE